MSGVLQVDLTPAADGIGHYFSGRDAAHLVPEFPAGITVELNLGECAPLEGMLGPLVAELRHAGRVVVVGSNPAGVGATIEALQLGLAQVGDVA